MNNIIAYNPCVKCKKNNCKICELEMFRQGILKTDMWISVEDRLPTEKEEEQLFGDMVSDEVIVSVIDYEGNLFISTDYTIDGKWAKWNDVTHWQPLPQPPQVKGAE